MATRKEISNYVSELIERIEKRDGCDICIYDLVYELRTIKNLLGVEDAKD